MAKALLADSVMFLGDYSSAVNIIDEFLTENVNNIHIDEWVLKYSCLKSLLDSGYPSLQKRDEENAIKFTKKGKYVVVLTEQPDTGRGLIPTYGVRSIRFVININ